MSEDHVITVLSVDDNPLMGEAVMNMIATPQFCHLGHFLGGDGVPEAVQRLQPHIVVMDLDMPGTDTISLVKRLTEESPDARVLMLSGHLRQQEILDCIEAGAFGYVHKDRSPQYIRQCIQRVSQGEFVLCEEAAYAAGMD